MISDFSILAALRALFKDTPTLEDFIEAHNPTDVFQVEYLEKQYYRMIERNRLYQ